MLLQSETQLANMYGDSSSSTIVNNCDTLCYFGGMDIASIRNLSLKTNRPFEEILWMPIGKVWILRRGCEGPIYTDRYRITENEIYRQVTQDYENRLVEDGDTAITYTPHRENFYILDETSSQKEDEPSESSESSESSDDQSVEDFGAALEQKLYQLFSSLSS